MIMPKLILFLAILLAVPVCASPSEAERIKRLYELSNERWELKLKIASTPAEQKIAMEERPDPRAAATALWPNIAPSLNEDWTIPYASFFLDLTRNLSSLDGDGRAAFAKERRELVKIFSENHLAKSDIKPFCIALLESGSPQALPLLEKIINTNPDKATQGIAALGASILLRELGDDPQILKKRLEYLRTAIIHAADQNIGEASVADIAGDELYIIRFLAKGRVAPEFSGTDVAKRQVRLSDSKGKVTVILFWQAQMTETDKVIEMANEWVRSYSDESVAVIGVTPEATERIRELQADDTIRWNNIIDPSNEIASQYRITNRPAVFVLNQNGEIKYTGLPGSFVNLTIDALLSDAAE